MAKKEEIKAKKEEIKAKKEEIKCQLKIKNKNTGNIFFIPTKLWEAKSKLEKTDFDII